MLEPRYVEWITAILIAFPFCTDVSAKFDINECKTMKQRANIEFSPKINNIGALNGLMGGMKSSAFRLKISISRFACVTISTDIKF